MNDIKSAQTEDLFEIKDLLQENNLPFEDIDCHINNFLVVKDNNVIIGTIGLENFEEVGLLRSFAVHKKYRNKGIGLFLLNELAMNAIKDNIKELYLLTTTADVYFQRYGFLQIDRDAVPLEIKNTQEFKSICPDSAICMKRKLV